MRWWTLAELEAATESSSARLATPPERAKATGGADRPRLPAGRSPPVGRLAARAEGCDPTQ